MTESMLTFAPLLAGVVAALLAVAAFAGAGLLALATAPGGVAPARLRASHATPRRRGLPTSSQVEAVYGAATE